MQEAANYPYITESDEMFTFIHCAETEEADKKLYALPKEKPKEILEKYKKYFKLEEEVKEDISADEVSKLVETITAFEKFCKEKVSEIIVMKEIITKMKDQRDIEINA